MKVTIEIDLRHMPGTFESGEIVKQKLDAIPIKHYVETAFISVIGPEGLTFSPDIGVRVNIKD